MKKLFNSAGRCLDCYRAYGVTETLLRLLHRFRIVAAVHTLEFYVNELVQVPKDASSDGNENINFREVFANELEHLDFAEGLQTVDWMRNQFSNGSRFFAAVEGKKVVSTCWIHTSFAELDYIKRPLVELTEGVVYTHGAVTAPEFRGLGIAAALRHFVMARMEQEGYKYFFGALFIDNFAAKRLQKSVNSKYWGRITYVKWKQKEVWIKQLTFEGKRMPRVFDTVVAEPTKQTPIQPRKVVSEFSR